MWSNDKFIPLSDILKNEFGAVSIKPNGDTIKKLSKDKRVDIILLTIGVEVLYNVSNVYPPPNYLATISNETISRTNTIQYFNKVKSKYVLFRDGAEYDILEMRKQYPAIEHIRQAVVLESRNGETWRKLWLDHGHVLHLLHGPMYSVERNNDVAEDAIMKFSLPPRDIVIMSSDATIVNVKFSIIDKIMKSKKAKMSLKEFIHSDTPLELYTKGMREMASAHIKKRLVGFNADRMLENEMHLSSLKVLSAQQTRFSKRLRSIYRNKMKDIENPNAMTDIQTNQLLRDTLDGAIDGSIDIRDTIIDQINRKYELMWEPSS